MRQVRACLWAVVLLLAGAPQGATAQDDTTARVDRIFQQWSTADAPGCALGVARAGQPVLMRSWGMADLEHDLANTPSTIFEAGSVSKQFTAAAIILLAQQGRLSLDDDVRRHVPELPDHAPMTIRHLLTHTSGLRDWGSVAAIGGWSRSERSHTHDHVLDILSRQRALNFEPGAEYSYSNSGYNLLAVIADRVSGTSFAQFSRAHIFEPLGMKNTQWRDDYTRIVKGRSAAYSPSRTGGWVIDRPIEHVHGNGGLLTTVEDLLIWNQALTAGRIGGAGFTEEMHRQGVLNDGSSIDYAAGLVAGTYRGVREVQHTGATSGYRAFLARYPDQQVDIALLCNAGNINPGTVGHLVADIFLADALQPFTARPPSAPPPQRETVELTPADLEEYAGEYYSSDAETTLRIAVEGGQLVAFRRPAARMPLTPWARDVFDASLGRVTFLRGADGRITQLSVRQPRVYDLRFDRQP